MQSENLFNGFDNPAVIAELAELYIFDSNDFSGACQQNSRSARSLGLAHHAAMWQALAALIGAATSETLLPFTGEVLSDLLRERLEAGDAQHFVVLSELLRTFTTNSLHDISYFPSALLQTDRARESYLCYIGKRRCSHCRAQDSQFHRFASCAGER